MMRRTSAAALGLGALIAAAGFLYLSQDVALDEEPVAAASASPGLLARGEYLTRAADCAACHSLPGGKAFAGGYPFKLPFGTIYSSNITADRATGIGTWSDDAFVRALQKGIARTGQHLYPAFPYASYTAMTRGDAIAIKSYLFSLPKVHAPTRPNDFPFPFNQRWGMAIWNALFLDNQRFKPDPLRSAQINRGAYLATALGHCGECHTPRNLGFAMKASEQFSGTSVQGWRAWNITSSRRYGLGAWSEAALGAYLNTGRATGHGAAAGPMGEVVENSTSYLTPADTAALIAYLRTVPAQTGSNPVDVNAASQGIQSSSAWGPGPGSESAGKRIFEGACASCHQWNGQGQQTAYAALAGSRAVNDPGGANVVLAILLGIHVRPQSRGDAFMPSFGRAYTDAEIAAVSNYVLVHFGGKAGRVTPAQVAKARVGQ